MSAKQALMECGDQGLGTAGERKGGRMMENNPRNGRVVNGETYHQLGVRRRAGRRRKSCDGVNE